jgi:hypothetical protein
MKTFTRKLIGSFSLVLAVMTAMPAMADDSSIGSTEKESASHEKAKEKSKSKSHSKKVAKSDESSKSSSVDININGLLLREFTSRYERDGTGTGKAGEYFGLCKPLTRALADYPVVYWHVFNDGLPGIAIGGINEARNDPGWGNGSPFNPNDSQIAGFNGMVPPHNDLTVSRYVQCRITASYWVAMAGERAAAPKVSTEAEVRGKIIQVFQEMDSDASVFQTLRQRARDLWAQESCSSWLDKIYNFNVPNIQCGVFSFVKEVFTVENRVTLSESSIDGHSYKIAVSAKASNSVASDDSVSESDKVSSSERKSASVSANKSK